MSGIQIPKINVPVGIYLISIIAIGFGEYYDLCVTFWVGIISGVLSFGTIVYTTPSYVRRYLKKEKRD